MKRAVIVDGDKISWAQNEVPTEDEMGKFVLFQDKSAKKTYLVSQIEPDELRKMRNKRVNVLVHVYGRSVASKAIHQKLTAALLQPANRDRAGAHNTVSLMEFVLQLKKIHGGYLSAHSFSWTMWANAIHSGPIHLQELAQHELPPAHLIHLFRSVPTAEAEVLRSTQNGLLIAKNLNDLYRGNLSTLKDDVQTAKENVLRAFDLFEARLQSAEEMLLANSSIVSSMDSSLQIEENAVSVTEEARVIENDVEDTDHQ